METAHLFRELLKNYIIEFKVSFIVFMVADVPGFVYYCSLKRVFVMWKQNKKIYIVTEKTELKLWILLSLSSKTGGGIYVILACIVSISNNLVVSFVYSYHALGTAHCLLVHFVTCFDVFFVFILCMVQYLRTMDIFISYIKICTF